MTKIIIPKKSSGTGTIYDLACPCGHVTEVGHLDWTAIVCTGCRRDRTIDEFRITHHRRLGYSVSMTSAEHARFRAAANRDGRSLSSWIVWSLNQKLGGGESNEHHDHDVRAIYIISAAGAGAGVTGHYISRRGSRQIVHTFSNCRLDLVVERARAVIHNPTIYYLAETSES